MEWHIPHFSIFLHISWMHFSHTLWAEFLFCPILIGKLVFYPQRHGHKMRSGTAKKRWIQLLFRSESLKSFKKILLSSAKFRSEKLKTTTKNYHNHICFFNHSDQNFAEEIRICFWYVCTAAPSGDSIHFLKIEARYHLYWFNIYIMWQYHCLKPQWPIF